MLLRLTFSPESSGTNGIAPLCLNLSYFAVLGIELMSSGLIESIFLLAVLSNYFWDMVLCNPHEPTTLCSFVYNFMILKFWSSLLIWGYRCMPPSSFMLFWTKPKASFMPGKYSTSWPSTDSFCCLFLKFLNYIYLFMVCLCGSQITCRSGVPSTMCNFSLSGQWE